MAERGLGYWGETADEYLAVARQAEAAGFHSVWSSELHRTAFVPLAGIAARTSRIKLGTGVALAFVRSPLIAALSALDLDELSGGRLLLGLGSGVQRLNEDWHNTPFGQAVPHMRETIQALRLLLAGAHQGRPLSYAGEYYRLNIQGYRRPYPPVQERIPIYLAAVGPHMLRLSGEVADGWLGHELGSPQYLREVILPRIAAGLSRAGRSREEFQICPSVICAIADDPREARRLAAGQVAFYATVRTYHDFFAFHGFEAALPAVREAFRRGDTAAMIDAVPDEMVDAYTAAGTVDQVRARLREYDDLADLIKLSAPAYYNPPEATRVLQRRILEQLGQ